jgi:hypothetical protein
MSGTGQMPKDEKAYEKQKTEGAFLQMAREASRDRRRFRCLVQSEARNAAAGEMSSG